MAWRDNLLDGALDGVPFLYRSVDNSFGRRTEVTEFPGRDDPYTEDFGRSARKFTIQAFVIGENYMNARDELIEVLEAPGDKVFTHPYRGDYGVKVNGDCRMTEKDQEGRIAMFTIPLVESGLAFPQVSLITPPVLGLLVPDLLGKMPDTSFNLLDAIGAVLSSITNAINRASAALRRVNGKIAGALNLVDNLSGAIDAFQDSIATLLNTPQALLSELIQLTNSLLNLVNTFVQDDPVLDVAQQVPDFVATTMAAVEELFSFESVADGIPTPTPQSTQERAGHATINRTVRASAVASGIQVVSTLELSSSNQARSLMENFSGKIDALADEDFEPVILESLLALKAGMVQHFAVTARDLPSLRTVRTNYPEPALVMAYRLYGESSLDEDIIRRNGLRHPAFIPSGVDVEVVSSG